MISKVESDNTMFIFAVSKSNKHQWVKISRPKRILLILDNLKNLLQIILDTEEDLSSLRTNPDLVGFTFTISNDPQQDFYGQVTNLGYYSIKLHVLAGQFIDPDKFSYLTEVRELEKGKMSGMLRYNFPVRRPLQLLSTTPAPKLFSIDGQFEVYELSFDKSDSDILYLNKLYFTGEEGKKVKFKYNMGCILAGVDKLSEKKIKKCHFEKEYFKIINGK